VLDRGRRSLLGLAVALVLAAGSPAWALETSVRELVEAPERFDGRRLTVRGTVTNLHRQESRKGSPYYSFSLSDGLRVVRVFSFGDTTCRNGESATVEGTFSRVKKRGGYTFYNEITGKRILCP
jgi:hypothetical protein